MPETAQLSQKIPAASLPTSEAEEMLWLRLCRSRRVGPTTFIRLIREHGSAAAALEALPAIAAASGARNYAPASTADIEAEWEAALAAGARPLLLGAPGYPPLLATIDDAPPFLWIIGDADLAMRPAVALVGARNASALGCRMATKLARDLGEEGLVVTSGLARGIDAAVHKAALAGGTVAVQAGGVDTIYPQSNADLSREIAARGLRLSEMPIGHEPRAKDFPRRNWIISGLSLGVVVIEGALRSGSLITARNALDQGREVMAVPGNPLDPRAGGCNQLIRDGATLVRSAEDILEAIATAAATYAPPPARAPRSYEPPPEAIVEDAPAKVRPPSDVDLVSLLSPVPVAEDVLIRQLGRPAASVAAELTDLELSGVVQRHPGGRVSLAVR